MFLSFRTTGPNIEINKTKLQKKRIKIFQFLKYSQGIEKITASQAPRDKVSPKQTSEMTKRTNKKN